MEASEIEREIEELETRIERLRALYEQYFLGLERLEPQIARKDVERRIWVLRREQIRNTGLRFKFQMLVQRYNTFQQYWSKVTREIENGTYRRDVMRAAQRVGAKEALTIVGRKRAEKYAKLAAQQNKEEPVSSASQAHHTALAGPTPEPSPSRPSPPQPNPTPAAAQLAKPAPIGLSWGMGFIKTATQPKAETTPRAAPKAATAPTAGRSRLAELAAEMRAQRAQPAEGKAAATLPEDNPDAASGIRDMSPEPKTATRPALKKPPTLSVNTRPEAELPDERLRQIYSQYIQVKRASNEPTGGLTYERLAESLRAQSKKLRATNPERSVDFEVIVRDGKTVLKPILK